MKRFLFFSLFYVRICLVVISNHQPQVTAVSFKNLTSRSFFFFFWNCRLSLTEMGNHWKSIIVASHKLRQTQWYKSTYVSCFTFKMTIYRLLNLCESISIVATDCHWHAWDWKVLCDAVTYSKPTYMYVLCNWKCLFFATL